MKQEAEVVWLETTFCGSLNERDLDGKRISILLAVTKERNVKNLMFAWREFRSKIDAGFSE